MADPRPPALVVEHVAGRRVAVAGGEPDVAATDLAELGRAGLEQRPLQLGELLVVGELEVEVDRAARCRPRCLSYARSRRDFGTLRA